MNILAIIPARGGSKGIKNKNIRRFDKLPLVAHTILMARKARCLERIIVSTDSPEISKIAKQYGAEVPFLRPANLARGGSQIADAVQHVVKEVKKLDGYSPDYIMLLQPTSPLRQTKDIDNAVRLMRKTKADSLVSICRTENLLFLKDEKHGIKILNPDFLSTANRQELSRVYKLDGSMIYLTKTRTFMRYKSFLAGKLVGYEIERWRAIDLDEPQDFVVGEQIFKSRRNIERNLKNFSKIFKK